MASTTIGSSNFDPAQSAVQKKLLMLNQKLSPDDTTAAATASSTDLGTPSAPSTVSGQAATPFTGTPNQTGSTTNPKFAVSDTQRAEMDAAIAATAAQNARSQRADQTDRLPPPPTAPTARPAAPRVGPDINSPDFYNVPVLGGIKRATDVIGQLPLGGVANAAATAALGARPPVALPTSAGDALGTLMPATDPNTGAAIADNPLYALGPAGNFGGEIGPAVGGLAGAIRNRIGGLGSLFNRGASVADAAASTAGAGAKSAIPSLSEPVDAMIADSAAARAKVAQSIASSQFQDTTGPALDEFTKAIKAGRAANAPKPGLGGVPIDNAPGGVLRGPTGEYIYNGQAYPTWAEARGAQLAAEQSATSASAAASGGLDQAIASKIGSIPGPVKAGIAAAGVAGAAGALAPTNIGGLPQASTGIPSDVNRSSATTPITDAAIAAQNAANSGATTPPATTPSTTPTPSTIGPSTTAPRTTTTTTPPQPPIQIPTGTGTGTNPFGKTTTTTPPPKITDTTTPPPPKLPTDTTQPPTSSGQLQQQVMSDLNSISQQLAAGPQTPDVMAIFSTQAKSIIDLITQEEANLKAEADKNGSTIDPATQNTLDTLRQELDRQIKVNTEQMNSRGLFNSGILEQAQLELRKGNMSDQAKLLSDRLTRIQETLQSGLASLRTQKVGTLSSFGLAGAQAQTQADQEERNRLATLRGQLISGRTALAGQAQQGEQFAANQQFQAQQNDLTRQLTIASKNADLAAQAQDREAQIAWEREKQQIQAQIDQNLQQARIDAGQYAPSPTEQAATAKLAGYDQGVTDSYLQNVRAFIAAGGDKQQLADFYAQNKSRMAQEGADLSKIEAAIR